MESQETPHQKTAKVPVCPLALFSSKSLFYVSSIYLANFHPVSIGWTDFLFLIFHTCGAESILHQLFIVRFLGSMEVRSAESPEVISETMRQILAARAIHNVFRMTESHLLVTCDCLKYEPQTVCVRVCVCTSVFRSTIYIPSVTYGHELWVVTDRMISQRR